MGSLVWLVTVEVDPVRTASEDCRHPKAPPLINTIGSGLAVVLALPLSGGLKACGVEAESLRWPLQSRGLFEVSRLYRQALQTFALTAEALSFKESPMESSVCHAGGKYENRCQW